MQTTVRSIELTKFRKADGPLTKRISLSPTGEIQSDGSACLMIAGTAHRVRLRTVQDLASLIAELRSDEALSLGSLREELPNTVSVTTKSRWVRLDPTEQGTTIPRTGDHLLYNTNRTAFALLDYDTKGMPASVRQALDARGGFWGALCSVVPDLAHAAHVYRSSTSAALSRADTGEALSGSGGAHALVLVTDGADVERFLETLHERCWLAGFGWYLVGKAGQYLERSIIDRMVGAPERLVFEGPPILEPPLIQDSSARCPTAALGDPIDTASACPALTILERTSLEDRRTSEKQRLRPEARIARAAFLEERANQIALETGKSSDAARCVAEQQAAGVLLPSIALVFDDPSVGTATVAEVLGDPDRFEGETLADPLEGPAYGACKAKVLLNTDGEPWINSFAHGRSVYHLKWDASAIRNAIECAAPNQLINVFIKQIVNAFVEEPDKESLCKEVAKRASVSKSALNKLLQNATKDREKHEREARRQRRLSRRRDQRFQVPVPLADAPWLPQMDLINDVLAASPASEPPMRDVDGVLCEVRRRAVPGLHCLTAAGSNGVEARHDEASAPGQLTLAKLTEPEAAELIERHIDYSDESGRSVQLLGHFVRHFLIRHDQRLPTVTSVLTMPLVLNDGSVLSGQGLSRDHGLVFRVPRKVEASIPAQDECGPTAVAHAMQFLADEWLSDVATDYVGKCVVVAAT